MEARVGAQRVYQWVDTEPDQSLSSLLIRLFEPGERLVLIVEARIGPYEWEGGHLHVSALRFTAAPGFNTGDHIHRQIEEIFYVVEGEFQIRAGDRSLRAKPGDFVLVPPGVPHGFANPVGGPAKMVLLISPAGVHERYFEELGAILAKPGPPDVQAIAALRKRYDTEQVSALST